MSKTSNDSDSASWPDTSSPNQALFTKMADDLASKGLSILPAALPDELCLALRAQQISMDDDQFRQAGIGRGTDAGHNELVRTDQICWISKQTPAGSMWLEWADSLRLFLNRELMLGLFAFESHFAHYRPGAFYKRHQDAFVGEANRVLSLVVYLNPGWCSDDGGELVIYQDSVDQQGVRVMPLMGTVVAFLSEGFPHEVLPAQKDRYSVAGWYRMNTTKSGRVDPPE
ncbi:2OG-Fe(II) oxygenase [Marinicella sediminis]|uniref:2OG-Fe(II) oxygenase n=1 Tax=Marinicella sediminis TaxID=1792834 RepID=A0ABV7J746_9GAMM|nr:2OG-Fe(II) oxygenase [Marinicella sediminis]